MNAEPNIFNTPVNDICKNTLVVFFTGQPGTKGGYWRRYDLVTATFTHYLKSSPKKQAHQIGGRYPYKGKRNIDLEIKFELKLRANWQLHIQLNNNLLRGILL
jgi:hypothetical protein